MTDSLDGKRRRSSMRTLFEIRAHRRTWKLVIVVVGFVASWLATNHFLP